MKTQQTEDKTALKLQYVAQWAVQDFSSYVMNCRLKMLCRELKLPNKKYCDLTSEIISTRCAV